MSVSSSKRPSAFLGDGEAPECDELMPSPATKQKRAVWSLDDLKVLQEAKRHDQEKFLRGGRKDKQRSSAERWARIAVVCAKEGVRRTSGQCKQKWENLAVDWNKITDYNRNCAKGMPVYWQMTSEERKSKGLPPAFSKDLFSLIELWYPRCRAAILDPRLVSDFSDTAMSTSLSSADEGQAVQLDSEFNSRPLSEILQGNIHSQVSHSQLFGIQHPVPGKISELEHPAASDYTAMDFTEANGNSQYNVENIGEHEDQGSQLLAKKVKRMPWPLEHLLILQAARRDEKERCETTDAHKTVQERWAAIASDCAANGVVRAPESCRQKWEQVATDWRKIYDQENTLETGATSYWDLSGDERKAAKLPFSFARKLFSAIESWYPRDKISVPDKTTLDMNLRTQAAEKTALESEMEREIAGVPDAFYAPFQSQPPFVTGDATLNKEAKQSHSSFTTAAPAQGSISTPLTPSAPALTKAPAVAVRSSLSELVLGSTVFQTAAAPGVVGTPQGIPAPCIGPEVDWSFLQSCINGISGQIERMAAQRPEREHMGQATRDMEIRLLQRFGHLEKLLGGKVDDMLGRVAAFSGNLEAKLDVLAQRVDALTGSVHSLIKSVGDMGAERDSGLAEGIVQLKDSSAGMEERAWCTNACSARVAHMRPELICAGQFPQEDSERG